MIPTHHKSKLAKNLSYPIGAQAISVALTAAPHAEEISLWFCDMPLWPASEFQRLLRHGLPYRILEFTYMPAHIIGYATYDAKWTLNIYAVKREFRHLANRLLREQGLPAIVEWLRSSGSRGWEDRQHAIGLVFDPTAGTLSIQRHDGV
jgi:hypothetical protein